MADPAEEAEEAEDEARSESEFPDPDEAEDNEATTDGSPAGEDPGVPDPKTKWRREEREPALAS